MTVKTLKKITFPLFPLSPALSLAQQQEFKSINLTH